MSLNPFNAPLFIEIKPTFQKALLIFTPHLLALALIISMDVFSVAIKVLLFLLILISMNYYFQLHIVQKSKKSITSLQQDSKKNWFITTYDKNHDLVSKAVILSASSFINKHLIVLNYRDINESYYSVFITPDSLSTNEFRYLQVRLKIISNKKS
ncbi:MAG: hypothetical protein L3J51_00440 [Cocleimonas sp.]|nr:hypothetical protein [Cocleimonas sp.]